MHHRDVSLEALSKGYRIRDGRSDSPDLVHLGYGLDERLLRAADVGRSVVVFRTGERAPVRGYVADVEVVTGRKEGVDMIASAVYVSSVQPSEKGERPRGILRHWRLKSPGLRIRFSDVEDYAIGIDPRTEQDEVREVRELIWEIDSTLSALRTRENGSAPAEKNGTNGRILRGVPIAEDRRV